MASLRDRFLTPKVARAITSPSAIIATGGGAALAILVGLGPIGAVLAGAAFFAGRVALAIPRAKAGPATVDPFTVGEPWRRLVQDALSAERQFDEAARRTQAGPLQDRLDTIGQRVDAAVMECWEVAKAGHSVSQARKRIDVVTAQRELDEVKDRGYLSDTISGTVDALEAQLATAQRMDAAITESHDRLRLLNARLDEAVTRSIELSTSSTTGDPQLAEVGDDLTAIVDEMEAYRQALDAVSGSATDTTRPSGDGSTGPT
jgi:hypothetical protein